MLLVAGLINRRYLLISCADKMSPVFLILFAGSKLREQTKIFASAKQTGPEGAPNCY